jgi:deoxyhypusine synthase
MPTPVHIKGPDFSNPIDLNALLESYATIGFQATGLSQAMYIVEEMVRPTRDPYVIAKNQRKLRELSEEPLTLFLGYTSNLISSGLREILRFLAQYKLVDCIVTTAGGIEEDFIKCLGQTILGDFAMDGAGLRKRG